MLLPARFLRLCMLQDDKERGIDQPEAKATRMFFIVVVNVCELRIYACECKI